METTQVNSTELLKAAVTRAGSKIKLLKALGISTATLYTWEKTGKIPEKRIPTIQDYVAGKLATKKTAPKKTAIKTVVARANAKKPATTPTQNKGDIPLARALITTLHDRAKDETTKALLRAVYSALPA
jgi:DNA-binding transcriptional regulator YdaS (Cro superfamily)